MQATRLRQGARTVTSESRILQGNFYNLTRLTKFPWLVFCNLDRSGFLPAALKFVFIPGSCPLEIALLAVPLRGPPQPFIDVHPGLITQVPLGSVALEGPVLPIPVHAAREQRRGDTERLAHLLADVARGDQRPHRLGRDLPGHREPAGGRA